MGKKNRKIRGVKPAAETAKTSAPQIEIKNLKYLVWALLAFIFILSLYIRAVLPYDTIFVGNIVAFASDDAVYQMRLVENTIKTFPQRISYDPWTYYPYGSSIHFGPLMSQMIAALAIIEGFIFDGGAPSQRTIDVVGAYFPAVMGALVVFPTYLIARNLSNRFGGLLSAFMIAVLPGQFLQRSLLGFTDHHVLETLFSTLTIAFFIVAVKKARDSGAGYSHLRNRNWAVLRTPLVFSILAGISYAAYQLAWPAASLMGGIIVVGSIAVAIFEHLRSRRIDHVVVPGTVMFTVALLLILPYIDFSRGFDAFFLSWFHITVTISGALAFVILAVVAHELDKRDYASYYYPLTLGALALVELIVLRLALPSFYSMFLGLLSIVTQRTTGGANTIAEAMSMFYENYGYGPVFTFARVYDDFTVWGFWFALIGLAVLAYDMLKKGKEEKVIVFFWSLIMLFAIYAQVRFSYYFAVNVAILSGYVVSRISGAAMEFVEWKGIETEIGGIRSPDDLHTFILDNVKLQHVLALLLILHVSYLLLSAPYGRAMDEGRWGSGAMRGYFPWYEAATWMRENTPSFEKDLPYYGVYKKPPAGEKYLYPDSAYGVMSWWDYGHIITYWAHRIPNANPFQAGIGGGLSHAPGASTFLTAKSEEEANDVLNLLGIKGKPGARYIVSNAYMA
ncbi:MAG TPA: oligosaccharyl transferase, archaeosortase A system-associated, partial [Candidatus Methanoperedenaceae archaeon]|nr:oligosaccharyl transferase, archaeosortase A system-associated [Candidatus Methanoperedenaceae archaeon]